LRTVLEQLGRLAEMLPAAFYVTSLELGPSQRVDLGAVAAAAQQAAGGTLQIAAGPWPSIVGDEALLAEALTQLFRNALEANAATGCAEPPQVSVALDGELVRVSVRDRGPGLRSSNPKLLIRLLQSTKPGHRGLGLVTVERIARLHGGSLSFESPGEGAVATLIVPMNRNRVG
jgi:signal transduction histidine kinase